VTTHLFFCSTVEQFFTPVVVHIGADGQPWGYCTCCDVDGTATSEPERPQPHPGIPADDVALVARYEARARAAYYRREAARAERDGRPTTAEINRVQARFYAREAGRSC